MMHCCPPAYADTAWTPVQKDVSVRGCAVSLEQLPCSSISASTV